MLRRVNATPCPVLPSTDLNSRRDSIFDAITTTNLDFTADFTRASLTTGVKPRRRQTIIRKEVAIYEDAVPQDTSANTAVNTNLGGSLLARPAKRLRGRVSFVGDAKDARVGAAKPVRPVLGGTSERHLLGIDSSVDAPTAQLPRRCTSTAGLGILKPSIEESTTRFHADVLDQEQRSLAKPPRRGTIYIPPEDTTMPSMYMGIFSPVNEDGGVGEKSGGRTQVNVTGIAAEMAKRRGRRSSLAAEPARRAGPLRSVLGVVKEQEFGMRVNASQDVDRVGDNSGKENMPPGFYRRDFAYGDCKQHPRTSPKNVARATKPTQRRETVFCVPMSTSNKLTHEYRKPAWSSAATAKALKPNAPAVKAMHTVRGSKQEPEQFALPANVPSRFVPPKVVYDQQPLQHFPPLSEDISNPAMYEDNWLSHQEIAITQLLNNLFTSSTSQEPVDSDLLRFEMLDIYQSSHFVLLHKRLHGAILHGTLRVPENLLMNAKRLQNDLGIRRTYVDLWTRNYNHHALKAALEVVVGRQCPNTLKDIKTFVEAFIIRNEDGNPDAECKDAAAWSYRRTILRSLMVIKLLDHIKSLPSSSMTPPLFLGTSQHKTSVAVLQTFITLLNPSMGQRSLSHLEYVLEHKQHPLEEFEYPVTNVAVELRDGVRLTRLVELLLYPSASCQLARESPEDTFMTLNMPTGEVLSMLDVETPMKSTRYPLSQHLKFPCEGRTVKLFNVQIAITALQQVKSMRNIIEGISADDIVDGFREKTIALLWGLTGKWGLGGLIDWKDVRSEIARFQRRKSDWENDLLDQDELEELSHDFTGYKTLLKAWAGSIASSKGLKVNNLTTSFSDGRVFEAIIEEYELYLPKNELSSSSTKASPMHERLAKLGCSSQFCSLFAPSTSGKTCRIWDRDFTLAALAFLCSRLLSTSRRARASVTIQRAWRIYQQKVAAHKQRTASMLAGQCAEVVNTRERLLRSKVTILKAWRMYKGAERKMTDDTREETNMDAGDLWLNL